MELMKLNTNYERELADVNSLFLRGHQLENFNDIKLENSFAMLTYDGLFDTSYFSVSTSNFQTDAH